MRRKAGWRHAVESLGVVTALSCSNNFEQPSEIRGVRVLAVQANPAQWDLLSADGGAPSPVTLTALAVDADGGTPAVTFALCVPHVPPSSGDPCFGAQEVPLDGGVLPARDPRLTGDFSAPLRYRATDNTGGPRGSETGFFNLPAPTVPLFNHNPVITDVQMADAGTSVGTVAWPLDTAVGLRPVLAEGSIESYEGSQGPQREQITYAWFATGDGKIENYRSGEPIPGNPLNPTTTYRTPKTAQTVTLYVVARDGRGGTGWMRKVVQIR